MNENFAYKGLILSRGTQPQFQSVFFFIPYWSNLYFYACWVGQKEFCAILVTLGNSYFSLVLCYIATFGNFRLCFLTVHITNGISS